MDCFQKNFRLPKFVDFLKKDFHTNIDFFKKNFGDLPRKSRFFKKKKYLLANVNLKKNILKVLRQS